jgi:hypothetical protein
MKKLKDLKRSSSLCRRRTRLTDPDQSVKKALLGANKAKLNQTVLLPLKSMMLRSRVALTILSGQILRGARREARREVKKNLKSQWRSKLRGSRARLK